MHFRPNFVVPKSEPLGIGKLVGRSGDTADVEFFDSPYGPKVHRRQFRISQIREVELGLQTRVFWLDKSTGLWRAGRVDGPSVSGEALGQSEDLYSIRFPNHNDQHVPVSELFVRWSRPISDPAEFLAAQVSDTPFFADGRSAIVRHFLRQRAGYRGLTALASSAIELIQHQVVIIRRVLADPAQRYILADEVGLGKTVEAGVLIRQHLIDNHWDHHVWIVVPDHLVDQWRGELAAKFFLAENSELQIVSESALPAKPLPERLTMLVVDEAHRTAMFAFQHFAPEHVRYEKLRELAKMSRSVLLLSGTPVLHQETGFLAMLHLLDPTAYPLSDLQKFKETINERQTVAEALMDLGDDASVFFAEDALKRLEVSFAQDRRLLDLCANARLHLEEETGSEPRTMHLRALREHLSESYKLHRRLLRTRRADPRVSDYLPRRNGVLVIAGSDDARDEAADFLEAWRLAIPEEIHGDPQVTELFATFVDASFSHPLLVARQIESRLKRMEVRHSAQGQVNPDLTTGELFPNEQTFLKTRLNLLLDAIESEARVKRLKDWLAANQEFKKVLLFVDHIDVADRVADRLGDILTQGMVVRYSGSAAEVRAFESATHRTVLVCDRRAEEGLNLQRVGAVVVHYDLPLEPARIEQRVGRVDRIEARGQLRNVVFAADHRYEKQWLECLVDTIKVFHRSVAPLQYALAESVSRIKSHLLRDGVDAISSEADSLDAGLDQELAKIQAQEALDAIDAASDDDEGAFASIVETDDTISDNGEADLNAWVKDRLQFALYDEGNGIKRYVYDLRRPTLLPLSDTVAQFMACIDDAPQRVNRRFQLPLKPFTLDRSNAEKHQIPLLRVGHPFIEALETSVRSDDRGRAFAMWRVLPSASEPTLYFRLDFLVEADLRGATPMIEEYGMSASSLRRRADDAFSPLYRTVWLSSDLERVEDPRLLRTLAIPYSRELRIRGGFDRNLRGERWEQALQKLGLADWPGIVFRAKGVATDLVRNDAEILNLCFERARRFDATSSSVASRLESRISRLSGAARVSEQEWAGRETALSEVVSGGISKPYVSLDCIGAVVLAGYPLES